MLQQERDKIRQILSETVVSLVNNGVTFKSELSVEGLLGVTVDKQEVFLVNIKEVIQSSDNNNSHYVANKEDAAAVTDLSRNQMPQLQEAASLQAAKKASSQTTDMLSPPPLQRMVGPSSASKKTVTSPVGISSPMNMEDVIAQVTRPELSRAQKRKSSSRSMIFGAETRKSGSSASISVSAAGKVHIMAQESQPAAPPAAAATSTEAQTVSPSKDTTPPANITVKEEKIDEEYELAANMPGSSGYAIQNSMRIDGLTGIMEIQPLDVTPGVHSSSESSYEAMEGAEQAVAGDSEIIRALYENTMDGKDVGKDKAESSYQKMYVNKRCSYPKNQETTSPDTHRSSLKCPYCSFSTKRSFNLKRHINMHTGQGHKCQLCGRTFSCEHYLKNYHIPRCPLRGSSAGADTASDSAGATELLNVGNDASKAIFPEPMQAMEEQLQAEPEAAQSEASSGIGSTEMPNSTSMAVFPEAEPVLQQADPLPEAEQVQEGIDDSLVQDGNEMEDIEDKSDVPDPDLTSDSLSIKDNNDNEAKVPVKVSRSLWQGRRRSSRKRSPTKKSLEQDSWPEAISAAD